MASPYGFDRLDPRQLDFLIRTVYGEAADQPALGQQGVAAVIGNRMARNGGTVESTVLAPNQFEPWGTAEGRARMQGLDANGPQYAAIRNTILGMQGDPTGGAMNFYAPVAQAALGRAAPAWATGPYQEIGGHRFYGGSASPVAASLAPVAGPVGQSYRLPSEVAGGPRAAPQPPVTADYLARLEGYRKPGVNLAGLQAGLGQRLAALIDAAPDNVRNALRINSGVRTFEKQAELYKAYREGRGPLAARPGTSKHERGDSLDLSFGIRGTPERDAVRDWVHKQAPAYGLAFPLLAKGEDWHIEAVGAPGAGAKVMPAGLGGAAPQNVTDLQNAAPGASGVPVMQQPQTTPADDTVSKLLADLAKTGESGATTSGGGGSAISGGADVTVPGFASGLAGEIGQLSAQALSGVGRSRAPIGLSAQELNPSPFVLPGQAQNPLAAALAQQAGRGRRGTGGFV